MIGMENAADSEKEMVTKATRATRKHGFGEIIYEGNIQMKQSMNWKTKNNRIEDGDG